ncbi:homeobox-leucine zipper protein HOX19-like isoform X2 [Phragmites australis]|uniref:homeobox-leucine zipper protein HOX19-like isoform X2 n=1 Tax=Phragmites australis TaxID=29695 RepID=UPI002D780F41|nr:homeobox-leucine zipper protein HOX19-like isoform X2 [Phragmites australis]
MAQEDVHLDDAGLALGLSLGGGASEAAHHSTRGRLSSPRPLEPSLTLSMPDEATATGTGTASAAAGVGGGAHSVSSLSVAGVKRERVEEAEAERASSTAAARAGAGTEDDDDGSTRKKLRLTKEQSALLEDRFKEHSTLNPKQKVALAKQLNLRPRQVEVWFQNRRARTKLKQTEVDCEFLKRCCETLTEENRRLQRELQELRALKFAPPPPPQTATAPGAAAVPAPPFYMQLPAATLTLCPSCERLGGPAADKADPDRPKAAGPVRTTHHFFNPFTHSAAC